MSSVAFLPMYAVRGARGHADVLWKCLRDSLRRTGIEAPEQVSDFAPRLEGWLHPGLILGQTCGLPYIARLSDSVELVGTPDYGVEDCPSGFYHSTLVASSADRRQHLSEFFGCTFAINGKDSQSGYGAMMRAAAGMSNHPLVTNQVEYHPFLDQSAVLKEAASSRSSLMAYCGMAVGRVFQTELLKEIAARNRRSVAQVVLRWLIQQPRVVALSRTQNIERIPDNARIFDFALSAADMAAITRLRAPGIRIVDPPHLAPAWD